MNLDEARSHVDSFSTAFNSRDMDALLEIYSDQYIAHSDGRQIVLRGKEEIKSAFSGWWASFSDLHFTGEVLAAAGDSYTCLYKNSGTHDGVFMGKDPTGKQFEAWGLYFARKRDGKMMESWTSFDQLGRLTQLGLLPSI